MATPESIKEHSDRFKDGSWRNYSFEELSNWVHLLSKRAAHRTDKFKKQKDLDDAQNYLDMMQSKLDKIRNNLITEII